MKVIKISKFEVFWQKREDCADFNLRINPIITSDEEITKYFTLNGLSIIYPTSFGVIDVSITDKLYDVVMLVDEFKTNILNPNFPFIIQLQRKLSPILVSEIPTTKSNPMEGFDKNITKNFRSFSSIDGKSSISMDEKTMSQTVGDNRLVLSQNDGITRNCTQTLLGVDVDSDGGLFTRTGILDYIPSILPFKSPVRMPDPSFASRAGGIIEASSKLMEALKELKNII